MKKLLLTFSLLLLPFLSVNADTFSVPILHSRSDYISNSNFSQYTSLLEEYQSNYSSTYPYYVSVLSYDYSFEIFAFSDSSDIFFFTSPYNVNITLVTPFWLRYENGSIVSSTTNVDFGIFSTDYNNNGITTSFFDYEYYDSNVDILFSTIDNNNGNFPFDTLLITNFYNDNISIENGQVIPKLKNLLQYNSFSDFVSSVDYSEVNLDNYEYVILSLKNYNQSNAFQTNLQLKGQIGITPVYNYGRTSKDSVTGSQVQDRCNLTYSDYTSYPFYILQTDLQNNAVYYIKSCSSGSSFKYDNTIFDISYVTQSNLDSPSVTINGTTYNTIPYADLPSSATQNEIDNYIPGESVDNSVATSDGLNIALKNAQNWLTSTWDMITYFSSFVALLFTSLPTELHAILITAFTITIVIGLIKHFTG